MNRIKDLFTKEVRLENNLIVLSSVSQFENQEQTNSAFSEKWTEVHNNQGVEKTAEFQFEWYLSLYGFKDTASLKEFLKGRKIIFDAGCGLGYKAAWFAEMAPESIVIGMDFSEAAVHAANRYKHLENLYFVRGDIADTHLKNGSVDYVSCDQVLHHTQNPEATFAHLTGILKPGGQFACYVYAKKAVPRELLDDHFREFSKQLTHEQLWALSRQLTELGKTLTDLKVKFVSPDIPLLGIKGGEYDIQRFLYWNFIKCFWREEWGFDLSTSTNFDWYAPSNAKRYSEEEYKKLIEENNLGLEYFHKEEACYSGRFLK